ncbi:MAG: DUF3857 domain-containing protein [Pyrinomonadaceae bacterium]
MFPVLSRRRLTLFLALVSLGLFNFTPRALAAGDNDWKPVDPAHVALKAPVVEKDADAEALVWEVRVDDGGESDLVFSHYLRIKIFTDRGRETEGTVELPFFSGSRIKDIAARTLKPDGQIVELKKEDVFEKTIVKAGDLKLRAKSFVLPAVEPGAIIEYRWREVRANSSIRNARLQFQRNIPVHQVTYYVKPASNIVGAESLRFQSFRMQTPEFKKEKNGFFSTTLTNVPAYREESYMPPEDQVRRWMLAYYSSDEQPNPNQVWGEYGKGIYKLSKENLKANDEVRRVAAEIVGDAQTPEQKLERLYDFCRVKIKNVSDDASGLTDDDRAKLKDNKSAADTLKRGQGTGYDVLNLFGALSNAAGFDARIALMSDRSDVFFDPNLANPYFIRLACVAVKVGDQWRFYDPTETYLAAGMLAWEAEGQQALIGDQKGALWAETPLSPAAKSREKRTAKLRLTDEGTLEGEVRVEYTGHLASYHKEYNDEDSPAQREETLRERLRKQMSTAELSDIRIENVQDPSKPFVYQYRVRVPGYAQRTGKRLFLQPAFFQYGLAPRFSTADRKNEVYFHYGWAEEDVVEIALPAGYVLDSPDAPRSVGAGDVSQHNIELRVAQDRRTLFCQRTFVFGGNNRLPLFPITSYAPLKQYYDQIHKADGHTLTLKQDATAVSSSAAPSN